MKNETGNFDAVSVASAMIAAARQFGYFAEGEALRSAPELIELERPLFVKMFQALKEHLQSVKRMELTDEEVWYL